MIFLAGHPGNDIGIRSRRSLVSAQNQNFCLIDVRPTYGILIQFGKTPDLRRLALFRSFYNTDGTRVYYLPQKNIFRYKPGEFAHALSNSPWKTGFMRAAFRLPFPYYLIYDWLKK